MANFTLAQVLEEGFEFPKKSTYGDTCGLAMKVTTKKEANIFLGKCVARMMKYHRKTIEEATAICKSNIGYWTGYCDSKTAERVMKLFACSHPIFGKGRPTPKEASEAGKRLAKRGT